MKATRELINLFRETADLIESEEIFHNWRNVNSCNCGLLVRVKNGWTHEQLREKRYDTLPIFPGYFNWTIFSKICFDNCSTTRLPMNRIISSMTEIGFECPKDFDRIEYLGRSIEERQTNHCYMRTENVITFFRAEADRLEQILSVQEISLNQSTVTIPVKAKATVKPTVKQEVKQGVSLS